ncbi:hypothetical protein DFH09DRAFT_1026995 [Mycena vulgaris]|nr:hypothetical protein DFH09DRAFT_1026995 [Mycena vulgaris]
MSSPPAKRQRAEDAPITVTRSEIWHNDGSVVLQAENTQFRVHWSVLSLHSPFFRDMQGLPQPPDQPSIDGCPVIELPDGVQDVEHLLKALYNPALFNQTALPFPYIASFVRLGRKYDFKDLFDIGVERLAYENPSSLEAYDALTANCKDKQYSTTRILYQRGLCLDTLTLACENKLFALLPCAYFRASKYPLLTIFNGISRADGTTAALSATDQRICALGRDKILQTQCAPGNTFGWLASWTPSADADCLDPVKCTKWRDQLLSVLLVTSTVWAFATNLQKNGCAVCEQRVDEGMMEGRANMWASLPAIFNLPPWNELKNEL